MNCVFYNRRTEKNKNINTLQILFIFLLSVVCRTWHNTEVMSSLFYLRFFVISPVIIISNHNVFGINVNDILLLR